MNPNLQELRLESLNDVRVAYFEGLALPQLRRLSLRGSFCHDQLLEAIVRTTNVLEQIDIG